MVSRPSKLELLRRAAECSPESLTSLRDKLSNRQADVKKIGTMMVRGFEELSLEAKASNTQLRRSDRYTSGVPDRAKSCLA
jgi:hypothetical protein